MSVVGADRVSWAILARLAELVDLSAGRIEPPATQAPPESVKERSEIPPTMPGAE